MPRDPGEARRVLHRAVELGVELIDTADSYGPDVSEQLIAEALRPYPDNVLVRRRPALRGPPRALDPDARPDRLREACEGSLRRLQVDCIGLYPAPRRRPRRSAGGIPRNAVRAAGRGQDPGRRCLQRRRGRARARPGQRPHRLRPEPLQPCRARLRARLERCAELGIPFIAWAPLAKGFLTRQQGALAGIAARHGGSRDRWRSHGSSSARRCWLPIPGTASLGHLEENARAATLELEAAEMARLDSLHLPAYRARRAARRTRIAMGRLKQAARREGR